MSDNQNFEKIIKKEKRKKWIKTALISGMMTVLIGGSVTLLTRNIIGKQMQKQADQQIEQFNIEDLIYSPNIISTSQHYSLTAMTRSTLSSDREKNVDGYHVAYPEKSVSFNLSGREGGNDISPNIYTSENTKNVNIMATNRKTQQKEPIFFNRAYPKWYDKQQKKSKLLTPIKPTHEASTLNDLPNTLGEIAITFDKRYKYDDILKMIPKNVMINYYWLGLHTPRLDTLSGIDAYIGLNAKDDGSGELVDKFSDELDSNQYVGYQGLKKALQSETNKGVINDIDVAKDAQKQLAPTLKTAKFAGVIVTGRTENLAKLDNLSYVYATNVGVTTPIMPYQKPIK
ncbi:anti sigma factor C-terminal domain-containing protein [Leuconostoc miyukkimchii]|uniref:anti sigma factor C-terminal domain-containing protein n=1 Tax=Leuconostoc miyukkimchii TaxID=910540 RepID=UPI001C7DC794|nr:anti sigma factor C-terminal domain-containing protein [Leuconostoc miyukkimchii]